MEVRGTTEVEVAHTNAAMQVMAIAATATTTVAATPLAAFATLQCRAVGAVVIAAPTDEVRQSKIVGAAVRWMTPVGVHALNLAHETVNRRPRSHQLVPFRPQWTTYEHTQKALLRMLMRLLLAQLVEQRLAHLRMLMRLLLAQLVEQRLAHLRMLMHLLLAQLVEQRLAHLRMLMHLLLAHQIIEILAAKMRVPNCISSSPACKSNRPDIATTPDRGATSDELQATAAHLTR